MIVTAVFTAFVVSCATNNQTAIINCGGGGRSVHRAGSSTAMLTTRPSAEVFGNQPTRPTQDVVSSTWGETMSTPYWWNDLRNGKARLQPCSANERILISKSSGFIWREGCGNSVAPAEAPTQEAEVVESSGGGNSIVQNGSSYQLAFNLPITIVSGGGGGGFSSPQRSMRPQQRPQQRQLRPQYCIVRDNCGRPIGRRIIGYR